MFKPLGAQVIGAALITTGVVRLLARLFNIGFFTDPWILSVVCLLSCWGISLWIISSWYSSTIFREVPRPPGGSLLFGHMFQSFREPIGEPLLEWSQSIPNDGLIHLHLSVGSHALLLTDPESLADVLIHHAYDYEKPGFLRRHLRHALGEGLVVERGEAHKKKRKLLMPAFQQQRLYNMNPIILSTADLLVKQLRATIPSIVSSELHSKNMVDIKPWMSRAALDIAGHFILSHDFRTIYENRAFYNAWHVIEKGSTLSQLIWQGFSPELIKRLCPTSQDKQIASAGIYIRDTVSRIVDERLEQYKRLDKLPGDVLSQMITTGEFTREECIEQAVFGIGAAFDTTANILSWALYHIAKHPQLQATLRAEVKRGYEMNVPSEDIHRSMSLLTAVILEASRLHPPIPVTVRKAVRDSSIKNQFVPAGTCIIISPYVANRSSKLWGIEAEQFSPERWLSGRIRDGPSDNIESPSSPYAYLTFLHGPRSCPGRSLAMMEMCIIISSIVTVFKLTAQQENEPETRGFLSASPKDGIHIGLSKLNEDIHI